MFKSALRSSAAFAVPQFAGRIVSVLLLPIYTRYLTTADYGILELLELTLFVYANVFGLLQSSAVFYYLSKDPKETPRILSTSFIGTLILGVGASVIGLTAAPWLSVLVFQSAEYSFALRLYFITMAFSLLAEAGITQLRAGENLARWNMAQLMRIAIQSGVAVVLLVGFRLGYYSMLWGTMASAATVAIWLSAAFYRNNRAAFDARLFAGMIRYSAPLSVGSLAMLFIHYGDRFFLQRVVSMADIGIYALAYKIGMLSAIVHTPFVTYWSREMYRVRSEADGNRLYAQISTYLVLVLAATGALLVTFARPLLTATAAPAYHSAAVFIPWITLAYIIRSISDHLRTVFYTEARTGTSTKVTILGAACCLAGYWALIPRFGVWGAVAATLLAFTVMCAYGFVEAQRVRHCAFEYGRLGKIAAATLAACAPAMIFEAPTFGTQCAAGAGFALLMPLVLWLTGFMTDREKAMARAALSYTARTSKRWQSIASGD